MPGTDAVHGRLDFEVERLVAAGWPVVEALSSVTSKAARLLGIDDRLGTLAQGKIADFVAVKGDVARDASRLGEVDAVVQGGRTVHDSLGGDPWRLRPQ